MQGKGVDSVDPLPDALQVTGGYEKQRVAPTAICQTELGALTTESSGRVEYLGF